ncbi:UNVERIFIED_CONTAM: hypothetical protein NCL1_28390 [Trichonephila clavipes]
MFCLISVAKNSSIVQRFRFISLLANFFYSVLIFHQICLVSVMKVIFVSILILAMMTVACRSASFSMACSTGPDGQIKCVENKDPNGNYVGAGSHSENCSNGESEGVESPGIIPYNKGKI